MNAAPSIATRRPKSIYQQKAEFILAENGAAAALDFARDVAAIAGADAILDIAKFFDTKGHGPEALALLKEICRAFEQRLDAFETLGKRVKSGTVKTGMPFESKAERVPTGACEFVTVLGNSMVRSFTSGTRFLPLLLAPGPALSFLTPETVEATKRITWNAVRRTDPNSLVLLVFGNGDASAHFKNLLGTWKAVEDGVLPDHETVIRDAARRCLDLIEEIRTRTKLNLVLFASTPMLNPEGKWLVEAFNEEMFAYARRVGLPVLDLTAELTDPATGYLWDHLRRAPDDPHMTHEIVPFIEDGLRKMDLLPGTSAPFEWDYLFRFAIDPHVETRIWGEPHMGGKVVMESQKFQLSQVLERAANIVIGHLAITPDSDLIVVNGREGFLPLEVPPSVVTNITSTDGSTSKTLMGGRVGRLLGRDDVRFITAAKPADAVAPCDFLVVVMHQDDDRAAAMDAVVAAMGKTRRRVLVITPLNLADELRTLPSVGAVHEINLSNRFVTGYWAGVRLIALTPAA